MRFIRPITVTNDDIASNNIPVTESQYDTLATYNQGDQVITDTWGTMIYESLVDSNTGNDPETSPTFWAETVPSNAFAMFDTKVGTLSTNTGDIIVELDVTGLANSIALINVFGTDVMIEAYDVDGTTLIYTNEISLRDYGVSNMYDYYFEELTNIDRVVDFDLPLLLAGSKIRVTIEGANTSIGALVYGKAITVGDTKLSDFSEGIKDYSTKSTDDFGNYTIVERPFQNLMEAQVVVQNINRASIKAILSTLRATPVVWVADETKSDTIVFGFYESFDITLPTTAYSECRLKIEGVT